ncbi:protein phosphatase 1F [Bombina bombina]|uniref:protein phosphatase 1F n=1 Tax=Bombina bombina TaxID=8345 RepID=UPI00235ADD5F|nr:protein phosphatase 1F [Bombina bombina]
MEEEDGAARRFMGSLLQDLPLQVSTQSRLVSRGEAEGELNEAVLRLLRSRGAPLQLAACLTHAVVQQTLQSDLSPFVEKNDAQTIDEETQEDAMKDELLSTDSLLHRCLTYLKELSGQWQKQLPSLMPQKRQFCISTHAIRNTRRKMEDRHVVLLEFNQLFGIKDGVERAYFAVFDGHGGMDAANYAATHVHVMVARHELLAQDPAQALKESFQLTDAMFLRKAKRERLRSGTTGVCALLEGDQLHVAWLGDSQALLVQQGIHVSLMDPHKPEREDERQRIESLGGCVAYMGCWRVNGTLAVSRAIGDIDQKPYVSSEGDVVSRALSGSDDFLVLACDGFFDTISLQEVPGLVLGHLQEHKGDGQRVAERLVAAAKDGGSADNITVLVVFLRHPRSVLEDYLAQGSVEGEPLFDFGAEDVEAASDHAG